MPEKRITTMPVLSTSLVIALLLGSSYGQDITISKDIGDAPRGVTKTFHIKCDNRCKEITATIKVDSGDPDLYAGEDQPPKIGRKRVVCPMLHIAESFLMKMNCNRDPTSLQYSMKP